MVAEVRPDHPSDWPAIVAAAATSRVLMSGLRVPGSSADRISLAVKERFVPVDHG